jgi:hypothetical protein
VPWRPLNFLTALSLLLWLAAVAAWLAVPRSREYGVHAAGHRWTVRMVRGEAWLDVSEGRWEPDGRWGPPPGKMYRLPVGPRRFLPGGFAYERSNGTNPRQVSQTWVFVPYWFLLSAPAVLPAAWAVRWFVRGRRAARSRKAPTCPTCGYDLRATPERCPECGTPVSVSTTG